ncbi:FadR/GntR family transcriptional regulator [Niallia circulans]|jgi:GntR family transcriptional regulator, transcriptional repressor for pyruvate dehydrogenase complex|uniref:FadR/GntR family transcriptional regulator n=1 Tax=Niallia circulans TaxID=1397 RepID=UPI001F1BBA49|nr:FadR/GntR family transcriptional regulator [Niallia circulans]MCF2648660.1 FadR family transcriptional regulator [Niallia circulans]
MEFKQIKPKKIYEEVADALYEAIKKGQLKSGEKLASVQQLADNFQVSRSAMREALTALKAKGLIELKQGEGTFVKTYHPEEVVFSFPQAVLMNKKDVMNLLEVRRMIESGVAKSAAENRTNQDLIEMKAALEKMSAANGGEELGEAADLEFHLSVAKATNNALLVNLLMNVSDLMQETMKETRQIWLYSKQTTMTQLYEEHLLIYQAILHQESEKAVSAMTQHLENVEEILIKYFAKKEK